jgi:hypothetical protein
MIPLTENLVLSAIIAVKACVLFIGATNPQWPINPKPIELFKEHNPNVSIITTNQFPN